MALAAALIFLFALVIYLPSLRNGFVWDDVALIENPDIRQLDARTIARIFTTNFWEATETRSGLYRPLTGLSFHLDHRLYGGSPAGFHFTNAVLNALVCVLVFVVLLEMFGRPGVAATTAVLFAVFPMHTENVAWVSGRTDVIATLFMLASLGCHARWRNRGGIAALVGIFVFFALALLAKEIAVVLPAVIVVVELPAPPRRAAGRRAGWLVVAAMCVMTAAYFLVRKQVLGSSLIYFDRFTDGPAQAVALSFSILAHYAYKLVYPFRLDAESDFLPPASFWDLHAIIGLVLVAVTAAAVVRWRRHDRFVFGLAVIACGLAPVLNILPLNQVLAERFLYFPSIGFCLLLAMAAHAAVTRWRMATAIACAALVAGYAVRTITRTLDWKDEITLFRKTVDASGDNARARAAYGASLFKQDRYDEALAEFVRATELNPSYAPGWSGRARAEARVGRTAEALEHIRIAIELDPGDALLYHHQGVLQFQAREYAGAAESFRRALEIRPRHMHARFNLGLALYQLRDFEGAVRELTALENKDTDFVNAWFFLAEAKYHLGNTEQAARDASHFLTLHAADDALSSRARELAGQ